MFTVTVSGALTAGDVPVGTPNDKSVGDTVTVWAFALATHMPLAITKPANARTSILQTLIAASLRGFPITDTNFFCGASTKTVIVCTRANRGDGELRLRRPAQRLRQELSFPHPSDVKKKAFWHTRSSSTTVEFAHRRSDKTTHRTAGRVVMRPI